MLTLVNIIVVALLIGLLSGIVFLMIYGKKLARDTSMCPKCGGMNSVSANPSNSRLVIECKEKDCGYHSILSVRASALSLFGFAQLLLTIIIGILGFSFGCKLGYGPMGKTFVLLTCIIVGGVVVRFFIRFIAFFLLRSNVSPVWQKEVVAYLAPILPPNNDLNEK